MQKNFKKILFKEREKETRQRGREGVYVCGGVKLKLSSTSWNGGNRNDLRWESVGGGDKNRGERVGRKEEEEQNWGT